MRVNQNDLGELHVVDPVLLHEGLVDDGLDTSLTQNAKRALDGIARNRGKR